ncbi:uncharacterized protein F4807DRAFT_416667 [Annulohypoxylon truncatum]|uniref:uncharacterized protein n=1 Tax=Annulohypoxylon truncatum TaxID=327061 RepID=UPI002007B555|nr:uncharacterized protein F4807DRAFT_416667 [Annulohypoxylon truncatum]KAI1211863.1 hypothetical protein F4807DRAFT_416667 [Annulohypoxylon truncatum]
MGLPFSILVGCCDAVPTIFNRLSRISTETQHRSLTSNMWKKRSLSSLLIATGKLALVTINTIPYHNLYNKTFPVH